MTGVAVALIFILGPTALLGWFAWLDRGGPRDWGDENRPSHMCWSRGTMVPVMSVDGERVASLCTKCDRSEYYSSWVSPYADHPASMNSERQWYTNVRSERHASRPA